MSDLLNRINHYSYSNMLTSVLFVVPELSFEYVYKIQAPKFTEHRYSSYVCTPSPCQVKM